MFNVTELIIAFFISLISSLLLAYPVKKMALKMGAMDVPNNRKIHTIVTPRLGGLSIYIGTVLGIFYLFPNHPQISAIALGSLIVVITGMIDDKYQIRPIIKLSGQLLAAVILITSGIIIEKVTLPVFGIIELGYFSIPLTILWIIGITNAINLIDGLDGLAAGVSTIAISSILVMAIIDYRVIVVYICVALIGSNLGFLFHNFHPAKIYMGDTGSLFLGYSVAVISMLGLFKNIALFSFVIPIIVLGVPILDTLFAIVRRMVNKEPIMMPDKKHIHYQLLAAGFSHRTTVLILYGFSVIFGVLAILFSLASNLTVSYLAMLVLLILIHVFAENVGLVGRGKKPLTNLMWKLIKKEKLDHKEQNVQQKP
ncbi:UDP-GlcNAc:undecaprenyl-phosphate GlcNAc-1-phosphate transferase [Salinibacillus kushneri]|uniref:UDP-GlcNAc:undecaprenyl-phosphate GlcNAc-1-phosphate transferase n=1 Tax=Salinibacillus kushneri TaxID=237682 RepID=A0A1I0D031_9BACI|nr:MraY family glycosyltransferase [Salinibacillus kushneri]SET25510.1 UDP-GlcNAc:undecaprenyl-phosphate GlcNAc-1-phosphate transferase [Salinibacillus kushneri]